MAKLTSTQVLQTLAEQVGKPLALRCAKQTPDVRAAYTKIKLGVDPLEVLTELLTVMRGCQDERKALKQLVQSIMPSALADLKMNRDFVAPPIVLDKYKPPEAPKLRCCACNEPVYFYEQQEPPMCLWCEKVLDVLQKNQYESTIDGSTRILVK